MSELETALGGLRLGPIPTLPVSAARLCTGSSSPLTPVFPARWLSPMTGTSHGSASLQALCSQLLSAWVMLGHSFHLPLSRHPFRRASLSCSAISAQVDQTPITGSYSTMKLSANHSWMLISIYGIIWFMSGFPTRMWMYQGQGVGTVCVCGVCEWVCINTENTPNYYVIEIRK